MDKSKDIGLMDRDKLLKIFGYLNERLKENKGMFDKITMLL
jgi:hypothetical protein